MARLSSPRKCLQRGLRPRDLREGDSSLPPAGPACVWRRALSALPIGYRAGGSATALTTPHTDSIATQCVRLARTLVQFHVDASCTSKCNLIYCTMQAKIVHCAAQCKSSEEPWRAVIEPCRATPSPGHRPEKGNVNVYLSDCSGRVDLGDCRQLRQASTNPVRGSSRPDDRRRASG